MAEGLDISAGIVSTPKVDITPGVVTSGKQALGGFWERMKAPSAGAKLPGGLPLEMMSPRPGVPSEFVQRYEQKTARTPLIPQQWETQAELGARSVNEKQHPYQAVLADLGVVSARLGTSFSTPENLSMIAGMMALGPLRGVKALIDAGFTYQMARDAYRDWTEGLAMYRAGQVREGRIRMMSAPIQAGLAILAGKGAFKETRGIIRDLHPAPTAEPTWKAQIADPALGLARERGFAHLGPEPSSEQVVGAIEKYYSLLASSAQRIMIARELGREVPNGDTMLLNIRRSAAELKRLGVDIHNLDKHPVFQRHGEHVTDILQTIASYAAEQSMAGRKGLAGMHADVTQGRVVISGMDRFRQVERELVQLAEAGHRLSDKDAKGNPTPQAKQLEDLLTEYSILKPPEEPGPPDIPSKFSTLEAWIPVTRGTTEGHEGLQPGKVWFIEGHGPDAEAGARHYAEASGQAGGGRKPTIIKGWVRESDISPKFAGRPGRMGGNEGDPIEVDISAGSFRPNRPERARLTALEPPAPPNPSPEARARDAAVDAEHSRLLARRTQIEAELRRLQAMTATKAFQRRAGRSQAAVLEHVMWLQRELERIQRAEDDLSGQMRMSVFGLDLAAKWAKRRWDVEIAPVLREWKVDVPEFFRVLGHAIAPRMGADPKILNSLMKMTGRREFHKTSLNLMLTKVREMFDTLPEHEQIAFVDRYKNGQRQPYSEFDKIVDFLKDTDESTIRTLAESTAASIDDPHFQALWAAMPETLKRDLIHQVGNLKVNPNYVVPKPFEAFVQKMLSWKKDHYEVIWKNKPLNDKELDALGLIPGNLPLGTPGRELRRSGLGGKIPLRPKGFYKRSTLDTMSDGIERGGIPVTYNPIRMFELAQSYRWRTITAMDMWNDAKRIQARKFVRLGDQPPAGWMKINDRMGEVWRMVDQTGGIQKTGDWYMHPDYARMLNNFLSRDVFRENIVGRGVFWAKNQWTAYRLGWSIYHASTETALAFGTKGGQAAQQLWMAARYRDAALARAGIRDLSRVLAAPYEFARTGGSILRYITNKQEFLSSLRGHEFAARFPDFDHMLELMFNSGVKLALHEDEKLKSIQTFKQMWADDKQLRAMFSTPWMLNEYMMGPLFEKFIPRLKLGAFASQLAINLRDRRSDIDAGVLTEGEVGRQTWNMIEDLFGQVNWDKFFWNNSLKTGMQILFRAPQFSAGYGRFTANTLRQLQSIGESAGYFFNQLGGTHFDVPPSTTYAPRLDPHFAIFAGLAGTWAVLNGMTTWLLSGQLPNQWLDYIAAKSGKKDTNGRDLRVLSPGLWKDAISLVYRGPKAYFQSKFSDPVGALLDIWDNKDFQNNLVYNPFDPFMKQQLQKVEHAIGLPIGASILRREHQMGESIGMSTVLGELGFSPAPPNLSYSSAENAAYELVKRRIGGKTPEEIERLVSYMDRKQLGQLTPYERMEAMKNARKPYLERLWLRADQYGATYDDLKYIYDRGTSEERKMLKPLMMKKYQKTMRRGEAAVPPQ